MQNNSSMLNMQALQLATKELDKINKSNELNNCLSMEV